jgi:hypothetical protein
MDGRLVRQKIESSERVGKHRRVGEGAHSWFADLGKLRIRLAGRLEIREVLMKLAAEIVCARFVDLWC